MRSELAKSDEYSAEIAIIVVNSAMREYVHLNTNLRTKEPILIRNTIS
jgi:hypothetical protein